MSLFQFSSLRWRLVAVMCLAYVIVAVISGAIGFSAERNSLHRQLTARASADAAILAAGAAAPLGFGDSTGNLSALQSFLDSLEQAQGVTEASIWGQNGCLVASSRPTSGKPPCRSYTTVTSPMAIELANGNVMGVAPIAPASVSTVLGFASVNLSGSAMESDLRDFVILETLVRVLGLLIFVLLSLVIARYILGPLANLSQAAVAIRRGHLSTRVTATGNTELSTLADAFNDMTASLEQRIEHLSFLAKAGADLPVALREGGNIRPLLEEFCRTLRTCAAGVIAEGDGPWWSRGEEAWRLAAETVAANLPEGGMVAVDEYVVLVIPLAEHTVFATVRDRREPFTEEEQQVAANFAHQLGIAADNVRLFAAQQEALQVKDQFLSIVSHELRTPLTTMKGYSQMLRRRLANDPDGERFATSIDAQVTRLSRLVDDLLDVTRFSRGQFELSRRRMDLRPVLEDAVHRFRVIAPDHALQLTVDDGPMKGEWDRDRIEQVLNNLIGNAIKYSPNGGEILVSARHEGDALVVSVKDQGIGISEEEQSRLFERFYRSEGAQNVKGLGLGLYVTQRVVDAHGGEVGVRSTPGKGSEFFFTLPLSEVPAAQPAAPLSPL